MTSTEMYLRDIQSKGYQFVPAEFDIQTVLDLYDEIANLQGQLAIAQAEDARTDEEIGRDLDAKDLEDTIESVRPTL